MKNYLSRDKLTISKRSSENDFEEEIRRLF